MGTDWEYETKDSLHGDITLTDQDDNVYTVSREEPTTVFESLGVSTNLTNQSPDSLDAVTKICQVCSTQMNNAKCNKTSCLNAFNTSFMPTLSYRMIATQFTEQQWNKAIRPAIRATWNAAGMAKNIARTILYGPLEYQGIGVQNPYILQGIIHSMAFLNEAVCNSSTGKLLESTTEFFIVKMGIPFSLTSTKYNEKTYASYMPSGWYKNLWRFMSTPIFNLEITEDYENLPVLPERDVYLMEAFVDGGFRNADIK